MSDLVEERSVYETGGVFGKVWLAREERGGWVPRQLLFVVTDQTRGVFTTVSAKLLRKDEGDVLSTIVSLR